MSATIDASPVTSVVRVCRLEELPLGIGRTFEVAGVRVALFRTRQGMIHATGATCPHGGAPMADGIVAGACVVCPYHARKFDLGSGRCEDGTTEALATYPVSVHGDWVSVDLGVLAGRASTGGV